MKKASVIKFFGVAFCPFFFAGPCFCEKEMPYVEKSAKAKSLETASQELVLDLHYAAKIGSEEIVRDFILSGASVNKQDEHGRTPLHYAAKYGYKDLIKVLLEHDANPGVIDRWGETPRELAQRRGHEGVDMLFDDKSVDEPNVIADNSDKPAVDAVSEVSNV